MGDTDTKRRIRKILEERLDSYYETLLEAARRETGKHWEELVPQADREQAHG
jgi:hypothetical protein